MLVFASCERTGASGYGYTYRPPQVWPCTFLPYLDPNTALGCATDWYFYWHWACTTISIVGTNNFCIYGQESWRLCRQAYNGVPFPLLYLSIMPWELFIFRLLSLVPVSATDPFLEHPFVILCWSTLVYQLSLPVSWMVYQRCRRTNTLLEGESFIVAEPGDNVHIPLVNHDRSGDGAIELPINENMSLFIHSVSHIHSTNAFIWGSV